MLRFLPFWSISISFDFPFLLYSHQMIWMFLTEKKRLCGHTKWKSMTKKTKKKTHSQTLKLLHSHTSRRHLLRFFLCRFCTVVSDVYILYFDFILPKLESNFIDWIIIISLKVGPTGRSPFRTVSLLYSFNRYLTWWTQWCVFGTFWSTYCECIIKRVFSQHIYIHPPIQINHLNNSDWRKCVLKLGLNQFSSPTNSPIKVQHGRRRKRNIV